ncbi:MAG: response regulator [Oscillospiraceae bacterium]|jgi:two-component system response regulator (stage 0 sporulation protein A)|nr:response regulator [Oscillospiraceae bacterium]
MERPLTVLLVEDDEKECREFKQYIDSIDYANLIGITNSDNKALQYVKDSLPDVVVMDLELHKGSGNGVNFLSGLNEMRIKPPPYVMVTTYNISRITHEQVRQLGTDFIMVKSQEDYCAENVIEFLRALKNTIQEYRYKHSDKSEIPEISPCELKKRQEVRVIAEVDRIGISPKAVGRRYLIDSIMYRIDDQHSLVAEVAQKYGKTDSSVERAMQNAINRAWIITQPDELLKNYTACIHSEKGVPTVTEFICHYANKIKVEYADG